MKRLSGANVARCVLGAFMLLLSVSAFADGNVMAGICSVLCGISCLPLPYERVQLDGHSFQILLPVFLSAMYLLSLATAGTSPDHMSASVGSTYYTYPVTTAAPTASTTAMPATSATTVGLTETSAPTTAITTTVALAAVQEDDPSVSVAAVMYRTPSGKRYHLDSDCGGKNSYEVTYDQAVGAGLTPCKKCAQ